jgi:hypothetical protein
VEFDIKIVFGEIREEILRARLQPAKAESTRVAVLANRFSLRMLDNLLY